MSAEPPPGLRKNIARSVDGSVKSTGVAQAKPIHSEAAFTEAVTSRWEVKGNLGAVVVILYQGQHWTPSS